MNYISQKTKLIDCERHGAGSELFIVEGDSASRAVARVRDPSFQAVLPMQGKPMNAVKGRESAVRKNVWYSALVDALGVNWDHIDLEDVRYGRILFLFDPDADGIHCGALMLMFFDRYLRPLLDANRVSVINPPLFQIIPVGHPDRLNAFGEDHLARLRKLLDAKGIKYSHQRYRGLASMNEDVLIETCLSPESRTAYLVGHEDAVAAKAVFGGAPKP